MTERWNWRSAARCRTDDADELFVTGAQQREARMFCRSCPVRTECLAHALDEAVEFGVWGGMTERERRALLRTRPEVTSWYDLLTGARTAHYAADPDARPFEHTATGLARAAEHAVAERTARRLSESA
ncbi:WhiB family transcriptional regulator [Pseudonocardia abyssalis]|jgi:WhiB family redox-sensing transcriptional regulator|uniref:Transcriptional regulator WhiB n=1 Tax=Pseudonocardia abyssalis TaxID=2792008 RepID=A0ABS6UYV0_9PSEU|nr:WhiB family transcriptional regulator [Pseudonocardia abyssalis]MBW0115643.1 WhiB family transcriptional regulator [Pseudonocardia abyssalis]MBW0137437.1 WhiB family transcriptional regulator [Pseudonocardia abyssalis]